STSFCADFDPLIRRRLAWNFARWFSTSSWWMRSVNGTLDLELHCMSPTALSIHEHELKEADIGHLFRRDLLLLEPLTMEKVNLLTYSPYTSRAISSSGESRDVMIEYR